MFALSNAGDGFFGLIGLVAMVLLFVLAVLWFILPFAVFGIKAKLDTMIFEQQRTNAFLRAIYDAQPPAVKPPPAE